jgi:predicted flap endonuclease-1-like 5' DNA nuclease
LPLAVIEEEKPAEPPSAPQAEQPSAPVVAEPILPVATETHVVEPTSVEPPTPVESALPVEAKVEESAPIAAEASAPENQMEEPAHIAKTTTGDDLTIIEGIGPKIAHILNDAGIHTYRDLANTSSEKLQELLKAANLAMANPGTWAQQAQLAAEGKLDELKKLQEELVGGRRASKKPAKPRASKKANAEEESK